MSRLYAARFAPLADGITGHWFTPNPHAPLVAAVVVRCPDGRVRKSDRCDSQPWSVWAVTCTVRVKVDGVTHRFRGNAYEKTESEGTLSWEPSDYERWVSIVGVLIPRDPQCGNCGRQRALPVSGNDGSKFCSDVCAHEYGYMPEAKGEA